MARTAFARLLLPATLVALPGSAVATNGSDDIRIAGDRGDNTLTLVADGAGGVRAVLDGRRVGAIRAGRDAAIRRATG